jgi:hypothetical protein
MTMEKNLRILTHRTVLPNFFRWCTQLGQDCQFGVPQEEGGAEESQNSRQAQGTQSREEFFFVLKLGSLSMLLLRRTTIF